MNASDPTPQEIALAPLRTELLDRARADADRTRRAAADTAAATLAAADARCDRILQEAVAHGEADAAQIRADSRARVRHDLRAEELATQRAAYDELVSAVTEAVCELRHGHAYPELRQRLADRARDLLGPAAVITDVPGGGIVARGTSRRLDYSLAGFAARAVERLGADAAGLWQP